MWAIKLRFGTCASFGSVFPEALVLLVVLGSIRFVDNCITIEISYPAKKI